MKMYKINLDDQVIVVHRDENNNIVIDDYQYEVEDLNTGKQYRIVAYSLQDGTDNIRLSFDLWNNEDECFEEQDYCFFDSDGGQTDGTEGEYVEDETLFNKVVDRLFNVDIPTFRTTVDLNQLLQDYSIEKI